jgi:Ca2+-binding EF-hand superfamily protein
MKTRHISLLTAGALALCATAFAGGDSDKHFKKMDADGDGKITRAEHAAGAKKMFSQCDANRDGTVTAAEMDASMAAEGEKPGKHDMNSVEKIRMIDQNGDGKLTVAEHEAGTETMFGKIDSNQDGTLSKEECDAGMKMKHKKNT